MWSLLEENGYTDEQLKERIEQIDGSDGVVDGRRRPQARPCRECGSMVPADSETCQFCGKTVPGKDNHPLTGI